MPISYKHKIYTTLGTPTNLSGDVVSATNSAGVPTKDYTVKGKTIVWNQLLDKNKYPATITKNGVTFTNNEDGTITVNGTCELSVEYVGFGLYGHPKPTGGDKVGHKYGVFGCPSGGSGSTYRISTSIRNSDGGYSSGFSDAGEGNISKNAITEGQYIICEIAIFAGTTANNLVFKPQLFDLTQMFGAGNEPATVTEFRAMFPDDYYPYNAGELKSIMPEAVGTKNQSGETRSVNIPSSKYFPDGMKSAGSAYDEINFLSQKAIKRIGVVDMGTLNWNYATSKNAFQTNDLDAKIKFPPTSSSVANLICTKYSAESYASGWNGTIDKCCGTTFASATKWFWVRDTAYTDAAAFKAAMSGVMLYYELATPVETPITPPLQALSTFKDFTSFSAPNSLTQNGPLSVTYYAEGGENPESGWLTSYKRKLYMGRSIEWNQQLDKSKYPATTTINGVTFTNNGDGSITANGTADSVIYYKLSDTISISVEHKLLMVSGISGGNWSSCVLYDSSNSGEGFDGSGVGKIYTIKTIPVKPYIFVAKGYTCNNVTFKPQLFDLTQMFGAGNEPATPAEFWSYFDHKLYLYNAGETQPLFKISRKSQWGGLPKHYTARWDGVNAAMVRLNDAKDISTDITNFAHRGSVNANYSNPFDSIYPWAGIKLCNISIDLYRNLAVGDSITKCVTAWEGDVDFSYNDANGVWRYRPEFWGKSWEDDTYRYFDVSEKAIGSYVHYPEAIVGRWHGRTATLTIGEAEKTCLVPSVGLPATRIAMSTLHTYAKNYGATLDSIYSVDADTLLCIVEFATMNTQNAIGNGVSNLYRQSSDLIQEDATNSTTVKVLAAAGSAYCIPGAIFDIGTSNGGTQVGSFVVVSATPNVGDAQYLDVTLDQAVTVTGANYWSVHGLVNVADEGIGSKSGYIGTNGKCNAYYRGIVLFGNMFFYTLGAYENKEDHHIWIANSDEEADNSDALDTTVHYDTGLVLPTAGGYTKKLGLLSRSGLLSIPVFCVETGGDSSNPVGDYFYNGSYTYNTVLLCGGYAYIGSSDGAFCGSWNSTASHSYWSLSARPRLKNP